LSIAKKELPAQSMALDLTLEKKISEKKFIENI
jgi:hypothetical protein